MSFLYPFLNFLQPGVLWPEIAEFRPMLLVTALALFVGLTRRSDYSRQVVFSHPIFIWLIVFILVQPLSLYYSGFATMLEELSFWIGYPVFVVISILLISNTVALKRYVWGMLIGSMVVVAYGYYAVAVGIALGAEGRAGAYGMYQNHNDYTFIILQILPFLYMYMRTESGLLRRGCLGVSLIVCVVGVFLSLSRGGILALALELVLIVLFGMQGKRRLLLIPVLAVASVAAIGYLWAQREENQPGEYDARAARIGRIEFWRVGIDMAVHNPFLGVGSRRFSEYSKVYGEGEITNSRLGRNAHNTYIEVLSGTGLIGFISFGGFLYGMVRELRRRPRQGGPPWLEATRVAALISLYTILFRALLDSKQYDWSFYTLCAICLTCSVLQRHHEFKSSARTEAVIV